MADITEVIHKISYEVNKDALENASKVIQTQLTQLQKLTRQVESYANQVKQYGTVTEKHFMQVRDGMSGVNSQIIKEAQKTEGILAGIYKDVFQALELPDNIRTGIKEYIAHVRKEFTGLTLQSDKLSTGLNYKLRFSLGNLITSLTSVNGLLKLGTGFFVDLATAAYAAR